MLNIIKSGFTSGGAERIREGILKKTEKGERSLLIVPEQQTLLAEAEMADLLPPSAPLTFEVTNFTRLANTASRALGGISGEYCDKTKRSLLMWRALTELSPILNSASGNVNEGLVDRYLNASASLDALGISAEMLSDAQGSEHIKDERLRRKLSDLSAVHALYKRLMSEKYGSSENECSIMPEKLKEHPDYLRGVNIYIEGFISFTETQYALIEVLSERCDITLLLYISKASGDSFEYTEVRNTLERLKSGAKKANTKVKIFTENSRNEDDVISLTADLIWRTNRGFDNISLQNSEKIRIFEADTPIDECDFIASDIKRRVMSGASFSDFAIVARDTKRYTGVLDTALLLADIPAFISSAKDVMSLEAVKLIFSAYSSLRSGYSRESVISYAKCTPCGISRDECDLFEYYAEKWQITGKAFADGEDFTMNPDGYSTKWSTSAIERLEKINEIKDKLMTPLSDFAEAVKRARTVKEQAESLYRHLLAIDLPKKISDGAKALFSIGEVARAEETGRLWQIICTALDTVTEVTGDLPSDADSFSMQLKILFSGMGISKIPSYVDEVTVGSADMLRLYGKKHIYLIGMNAGEFPATVSDNAYFTEADKSALARAGLSLTPDLEVRAARELYLFARAFTYAKDTVTLSYTARDAKYKPHERSDVIDKLIRIFDGLEVKKISELPAKERIFSAKPALVSLSSLSRKESEAAERALAKAGQLDLISILGESITNEALSLSPELADGKRDAPISLTQSRIDSFMNCPLSYFCRYTLSLTPEERAEFDARNIGTFIHAILENVFRYLSESDRDSGTLTREERAEITLKAAKKYVSELGESSLTSERTRIKLDRLVRASMPVVDGLCDEFAASKFKPKFFELAITRGKEDSPEPVTARSDGGKDIYIYGFIDRVDTYESGDDVYVRVVDYKTGKKIFSPDDPKEGKNLQMFLYLKSILDEKREEFTEKLGVKKGGRIIPAGVIYVKTSIGDVRVERPDDALALEAVKSAQKREGMVLDDEEIISAMGLEYTPLYSAKTPDKIPESKRKFLFTEESLDGIFSDCTRIAGEVADGITEGNIKAIPRTHEGGMTYCESCEFKPICRKAVINK